MNKKKTTLLRLFAVAAVLAGSRGQVSAVDTICVSCGPLQACLRWGAAIAQRQWCGATDHDLPQACTDYYKQRFACLEGGLG